MANAGSTCVPSVFSRFGINYWRVFNVINQVDERVLRCPFQFLLLWSFFLLLLSALNRVQFGYVREWTAKSREKKRKQSTGFNRWTIKWQHSICEWCVSIALPFFRSNIINYAHFFSTAFLLIVFHHLSRPSFTCWISSRAKSHVVVCSWRAAFV